MQTLEQHPSGVEVKSLPEAIYTAERLTVGEYGRQFTNFGSIESFVDGLVSSNWWMRTFPNAPVHVHVDKRSPSARFSVAHDNVIALANNPQGRNIANVLHELAHVATMCADGHGPIFRGAMLKLVRSHMGFYAYVDLEREYRNQLRR